MKTRLSAAFSLVEVTLALGVAAFCLIAVFGLLPVGVNSDQTSIQQTAAASLATSISRRSAGGENRQRDPGAKLTTLPNSHPKARRCRIDLYALPRR